MSEGVNAAGHLDVVGRVEDLVMNSMMAIVLSNGDKVCLVRTAAGVCALVDRCSHREFPLTAGEVTADGMIECAWHGAQFDPSTGVMLTGPGGDDVKRYDVRLDGDTITIDPTSAR